MHPAWAWPSVPKCTPRITACFRGQQWLGGRSGAAGEPAGERSRRANPKPNLRRRARRERHTNPSPSLFHRADLMTTLRPLWPPSGRSQIFDRLLLRGPDSRPTAVCGHNDPQTKRTQRINQGQIITRRWVERAAPVTTRSRRHTASSAVSTTPTSRALSSRTSSRK